MAGEDWMKDFPVGERGAINWLGSLLISFSALDVNATEYLSTQLSACNQAGLHPLDRNPFFMPPRPGNQHVLDILPQRAMFLEVDYRRLAAFLIGNELNSGHFLRFLGQTLRFAPSTE
jgi:hypothetical protein